MKKQRGVFEKISGSGVWWIQYFDAAGRRRREKVGKKSAAITLVESRRTDARKGVKMAQNLRAKPVTFRELADRTLIYSRANKKSYIHDVSRMRALVAEFGDRPAETITRATIQEWLDTKAAEWAPATRNRHLMLMKLTFRLAEEDGVIKLNPARLVRQSREDNRRLRFLSDAEEVVLRDVMEKHFSDHLPEFEISLMTGMRMSEQFSLTWEDIDLKAGRLELRQTKNGQSRHVQLNSRALAVLGMLHDQGLGTGRVFSNLKPRWLTKAARMAGLNDFTWHTLRHTFASRLVMAGVDLRTVQELMGHKSIIMTTRYAHLSPEHLSKALAKLCEPTATRTATETKQREITVAPVIN